MQPQLQRVEVEAVRRRDHDLAVDHAARRQPLEQRLVQLREIAVERPQVAALDEDVGAAAKDDGAKAVPLRLEEKARRSGRASASLASIGSIGGTTRRRLGIVDRHEGKLLPTSQTGMAP